MGLHFSDTTNKDGVLQYIEQTLGLGDGAISGNTVKLAYFTGLVNKWLNIATVWIQQVEGEWNYDDSNYSNFPIKTYSITDNQDNYSIDNENVKVLRRVEGRDASSQDFYDLDYYPEKDRPEDRFDSTADKVKYFWLDGNGIIFYPVPDISKTDQYRLTFDRDSKQFTTSDTNTEIGFDQKLHWILVYGPAMDQARIDGEVNTYSACYQALFGTGNYRDVGLKEQLQQIYFKRSNVMGGSNIITPQAENF